MRAEKAQDCARNGNDDGLVEKRSVRPTRRRDRVRVNRRTDRGRNYYVHASAVAVRGLWEVRQPGTSNLELAGRIWLFEGRRLKWRGMRMVKRRFRRLERPEDSIRAEAASVMRWRFSTRVPKGSTIPRPTGPAISQASLARSSRGHETSSARARPVQNETHGGGIVAEDRAVGSSHDHQDPRTRAVLLSVGAIGFLGALRRDARLRLSIYGYGGGKWVFAASIPVRLMSVLRMGDDHQTQRPADPDNEQPMTRHSGTRTSHDVLGIKQQRRYD